MSLDDLTPFLVPAEGNENMRFGQATLTQWNPDTYENRVDFRGTTLTNLPVAAGADALTWTPGDQLILHGYAPNGGLTSWWIAQRVIIPGTGAAEKAIEFLRSTLARQLSAEVFADRIFAIPQNGTGTRPPNDTWGDLVGATVGPAVTANISPNGVAIVFVASHFSVSTVNDAAWWGLGGAVSYQATGANTIAPANERSLLHSVGGVVSATIDAAGGANAIATRIRAANFSVLTGLNPGDTTFTTKYLAFSGNPQDVPFNDRDLMVIAL